MLPNGWKKSKIGETCSLLSGQDFPPNLYGDEEKGLPYITGASNFAGNHIILNRWTEHPKNIAKKGDILLVCKGSGFGITAIADFEKAHIARQVMALQKLNGVDRDFLYQVVSMNVRNIKQKGCGLIPGIDRKTVLNIEYLLPPIEEQKKIAATLSVWDSAIEKMGKLIDAKENHFNQLMNKLIVIDSSNSKWNTFALKNVFDVVNRKNKNGNTNVLTSSAQYGLVNQQEYYKKKIASSNTSGYYLLKKGDFAYNRSYSTGYPYGVVKRLDKYELGVLSTLYLCFSLKKEYQSYSDFFVFLFESGYLNNQLALICREGARNHGLLNVSKEDFFNMKVQLPNEKEQQSIVCILHNRSLELSLLKQQLENYKKQKQGLMQKLLTGQWRVK